MEWRCPVCGGGLAADYSRDETACRECGLVVGNIADIGAGWLAAEPLKRMRTAPLKGKTEIGARLEHGLKWLALAKLDRETLHGRERTLKTIQAEVMRLRSCVGLPQHIADKALTILREVKLEHARWERRGDKFVKVYRPKGLQAFAEGAKEYVQAV